ncbi:MAG: phospholipid carrier-dependent glycosyltransferase [Myxococcales bacterium]|nr:phospholipid carrier-dependent glycosyltransferase [Myxococcales bacterium]
MAELGTRRNQERLLALVCVSAVALGVWLRVQNIAEPAGLAWDEHHFVKTAQNYLHGQPDWNDHPPLGKLLIAQAIHWFGDTSLAWRASALLAGLLNIGLVGVLAARVFRSRSAGLLGAAFIAGDGFFIAYSRTALLDGVLTTFVLATACVIVRARSAWQVALASLLLGLGCNVKFSAIVMLVPIVGVALFGRAPLWSLVFLLLAPLDYFLLYRHGLALQHKPHTVADVIDATRVLYEHHAKLTDMTHIYVSRWYTWLLPHKPIPMRFTEVDGVVRSMSSMGNPLLWWAASLSVLTTASAFVSTSATLVWAKLRARATPLHAIGAIDRDELWVLFLWALPVLPWVVSRRDSYIYHYLPAYGFAVALVAGKLGRLIDARRRHGWFGVGALVLTAWWVAPVSAELPVSRLGYELRLWFPGWRKARPRPPLPSSTAVPRRLTSPPTR